MPPGRDGGEESKGSGATRVSDSEESVRLGSQEVVAQPHLVRDSEVQRGAAACIAGVDIDLSRHQQKTDEVIATELRRPVQCRSARGWVDTVDLAASTDEFNEEFDGPGLGSINPGDIHPWQGFLSSFLLPKIFPLVVFCSKSSLPANSKIDADVIRFYKVFSEFN